MEGTDVSVGKDPNYSHDHTYYGNGCPNKWETDGAGGSTTACTTRLTQTADNEVLSVGTYYSYQAATNGSGASITTNNTNTPDTFCPLGWQLPYSGTGGDYYNQSKSWLYLFEFYGPMNGTKLNSFPLSYIDTGIYHWTHGKLYGFYSGGFETYWSATSYANSAAYRLDHWDPNRQTPSKTNGHALRCLH